VRFLLDEFDINRYPTNNRAERVESCEHLDRRKDLSPDKKPYNARLLSVLCQRQSRS
jgi:hypothetical protein